LISKIIEHRDLILTDFANNHNKFYKIALYDDRRVVMHWGRVGANTQPQTKSFPTKYATYEFYRKKVYKLVNEKG